MTRFHSSDHGGAPVLDAETLDSLAALGGDEDPDLVGELIDLYIEDASERVEAIARSLTSRELETIARAAHALKSASANVGALPFSAKCRELEAAARDGDAVDDVVRSALSMFQEVREALAELRSTQA